jgi:hypothetical protein
MTDRVVTRAQLEELLQRLPVSTPEDQEVTTTALQTFITVRNEAIESTSGLRALSLAGASFSIPVLIQQLQAEDYADAAQTLIGMMGEVATAYSVLMEAAVGAGAVSGTSAAASSGVVAGMLGEAAGPAGIAIATLVAVARIPGDVSANQWKIFYIADVSGILTSWLFNRPEISPHDQLMRRSRTAGYMRTNISGACREAHRHAHRFWVNQYQNNLHNRRNARSASGGEWSQYWQLLAQALDASLQPAPTGVGAAMVRGLINSTRRDIRDRQRQQRNRQAAARTRAAQGGQWIRTPDGLELFIPDD